MSKNQRIFSNKYTSNDWESLRDYVFNNFIKKYFLNSFNNFSPDLNTQSLAQMMLETNIALTDILRFYMDTQYDETNIETAEQEKNIWSLAETMGYKPKLRTASTVNTYIYCMVRASGSEYLPDGRYAPVLKAGSSVISNNGQIFELISDINMSSALDTSDTVVAERSGGNPSKYSLRRLAKFQNGRKITTNVSIGSFQKFRKVVLPETNIIDVINVVDTQGNKYEKVNYLAQDVVYEKMTNIDSDSNLVPYILRMKKVPFRFTITSDPETELTYVNFGSGNSTYLSSSLLIPDPSMYAVTFCDDNSTLPVSSINPEYFTGSLSLGIAPDSDITITYRIGGGLESNVGAGDIRDPYIVNMDFSISNLDSVLMDEVKASFAVNNLEAADGGQDKEDIDTVKQMAVFSINSQNRCVTPPDFIAKIYSMPALFGTVYRMAVEPQANSNTIRLYILSKDSNGYLTLPSDNLKENIRNWISLDRLYSSGIEITDGEIINLKIKFKVMVEKKYNSLKVLWECIENLKEAYDISKLNIGQPMVISNIYDILSEVEGVFSVEEVKFEEDFSVNVPSISRFRVIKFQKGNILYLPSYAMPEIRNPNQNIIGIAI